LLQSPLAASTVTAAGSEAEVAASIENKIQKRFKVASSNQQFVSPSTL